MKNIIRWFNRKFRDILYVGFDDIRIQELLDEYELDSICYNEKTGKVYNFQ